MVKLEPSRDASNEKWLWRLKFLDAAINRAARKIHREWASRLVKPGIITREL